jgi:hypothetical protein
MWRKRFGGLNVFPRGAARGALSLSPLIGMLMTSGCAMNENEPVRPLKPLELAMSTYDGNIVERRTGTLAYENDCLLFRDDNGGPLVMPIWPAGSAFDGFSLKYHEPGRVDQAVLIARHFVMGGRLLTWQSFHGTTFEPFQSQCHATPFVVSEVRPAD